MAQVRELRPDLWEELHPLCGNDDLSIPAVQ